MKSYQKVNKISWSLGHSFVCAKSRGGVGLGNPFHSSRCPTGINGGRCFMLGWGRRRGLQKLHVQFFIETLFYRNQTLKTATCT